jgi:hypothetical protein
MFGDQDCAARPFSRYVRASATKISRKVIGFA